MKKVAIVLSLIVSVGAQTEVTGIISENTTWTKSNSPYKLTGMVQVAYGSTLTIEAGTTVKGHYNKLMIFGKLSAIGTDSEIVKFDSVFIGAAENSSTSENHEIHIEYSHINRGSFYEGTGNPNGHLILKDSKIESLDRFTYLWHPTSDCYIERNIFLNTTNIKISNRGSAVIVIKNNFFRNDVSSNTLKDGYAIHFDRAYKPSSITVKYNTFFNTDKIALSVSKYSSGDSLDAKQNYWNTTDENVIQSMIYDKTDDLSTSFVIQYSPSLTSRDESTPHRGFEQIKVPSKYSSIQAGINASMSGDTVLVAAGTYTENIIFNGKNIVVMGENTKSTIIEGADYGSVVTFNSKVDSTAKLSGFTIRNGHAGEGGGITITGEDVNPVISNCIIKDNKSDGYGGGAYVHWKSNPKFINCIFLNNNCSTEGAGIEIRDANAEIINCSIIENYNGAGISLLRGIVNVKNSIMWSSWSTQINHESDPPPTAESTIEFSLIKGGESGVLVQNGTTNWGTGNLNLYPIFVDTAGGDYHLSDYSPAIGTGTTTGAPTTDIEGNPRPNPAGSNPDMGAYENSLASPLPKVLKVPTDYATIKLGLDAANNGDTVLVAEGTVAQLSESVAINSGIILKIGKGSRVEFAESIGMDIYGTLIAKGDSLNYIHFTSSETDSSKYWGFLKFHDNSEDYGFEASTKIEKGSLLEYCIVERGSGSAVIDIDKANPKINFSIIKNNKERGIRASPFGDISKVESFFVENSIFKSNGWTGLTVSVYNTNRAINNDGSSDKIYVLNNRFLLNEKVVVQDKEGRGYGFWSDGNANESAMYKDSTILIVEDNHFIGGTYNVSTNLPSSFSRNIFMENLVGFSFGRYYQTKLSIKNNLFYKNQIDISAAGQRNWSSNIDGNFSAIKNSFVSTDSLTIENTFTYEMENNYWGVSDSLSIAKKIENPNLIDFIPFLTSSDGNTPAIPNQIPIIAAIPDLTIDEDTYDSVKVSVSDADGDPITLSAKTTGDYGGLHTAFLNDTTLFVNPNPNWNGTCTITFYASDGKESDSTSFKLIVNPIQDAPTTFEWVSTATDSINISQTNLSETYSLQWDASTDVDGDSIDYLVSVKIGVYPSELIYDTTVTTLPLSYQEIVENVFEGMPNERATVRFSVSATDGIDTVKVTGDDRVLFVNRYEYLSTVSEGIPTEFALHENYPNPFNPTTTLRFDLPQVSDATVTIYNMLGQKVRTFNMNDTPAGYHTIKWDATNDYGDPVGAGVYLYQLRANEFVKTKKMVLLK